MLDLIIIILVLAWIGGYRFHIGGGLIHLLLVIAIVVLILRILGIS